MHRCKAMAAALYEAVGNTRALTDSSTDSLIMWELARCMEERADAAVAALAAAWAEIDGAGRSS